MEETTQLTMGHICRETGLSATTVRAYIKHFGLQTARTENGHHRFHKEIIPILVAVKEKLQQQGWTYQQVQNWLTERDGVGTTDGEPALLPVQPRTSSSLPEWPLEEKLVLVTRKLDELADLVQSRLETGTAIPNDRHRQLREHVVTEQVKARLRVDAIQAWGELPLIKRTLRAGLFRRQEDVMKRETFIAEYIRERLEEELERELGMRETAAAQG